MRLLLGKFFRHVSSLFPSDQSDHSDSDDRIKNIDDSDNDNHIVSFMNKLYCVFQKYYRSTNDTNHSSVSRLTSIQIDRDMDHGDAILLSRQRHQDVMIAIEDHTDLVLSFLIENVECIVGTMHASFHYLQNIGAITH